MNTTNNGCGPVWERFVMAVLVTMVFINSAQATFRMEYQAVVTNVLDGNTVVINNRMLKSGGFYHKALSIRLDGIESPGLIDGGGKEARILLENLVLGKDVFISELFDSGVSRGACLFVLDDSRRYTEKDCINFMLVSNGMSRFTGYFKAFRFDTRESEEAQRQAQKAHRGIWGFQPETALTPPSSPTAIHVPAAAASQGAVAVPEKAEVPPVANPPAAPPPQTRLVVPLAVGAGVLAALALIVAHFRRRR